MSTVLNLPWIQTLSFRISEHVSPMCDQIGRGSVIELDCGISTALESYQMGQTPVLQGPQQLPIFWSHIHYITIVSDTSNSRPQNDVGNSVGSISDWKRNADLLLEMCLASVRLLCLLACFITQESDLLLPILEVSGTTRIPWSARVSLQGLHFGHRKGSEVRSVCAAGDV